MATPEINLSPEALKIVLKDEHLTAGVEDGKEQGQAKELNISSPRRVEVPIIYRYLTFETELPSPTSLEPAQIDAPVPEPPDLKNYVSPFTWSAPRKTFTTWLSCAITVVTAYTAGSYSPPSQQMSDYWGVSQLAIFVGITTFATGFAVAPMVLAPFSELNGRKPVFVATGILFVLCQLCCAVTRSFPGMLLARFFAGVGGSTFSTMVGGVVSDIYHAEGIVEPRNPQSQTVADIDIDRNTAMSLFAGAALFGTGLYVFSSSIFLLLSLILISETYFMSIES